MTPTYCKCFKGIKPMETLQVIIIPVEKHAGVVHSKSITSTDNQTSSFFYYCFQVNVLSFFPPAFDTGYI